MIVWWLWHNSIWTIKKWILNHWLDVVLSHCGDHNNTSLLAQRRRWLQLTDWTAQRCRWLQLTDWRTIAELHIYKEQSNIAVRLRFSCKTKNTYLHIWSHNVHVAVGVVDGVVFVVGDDCTLRKFQNRFLAAQVVSPALFSVILAAWQVMTMMML